MKKLLLCLIALLALCFCFAACSESEAPAAATPTAAAGATAAATATPASSATKEPAENVSIAVTVDELPYIYLVNVQYQDELATWDKIIPTSSEGLELDYLAIELLVPNDGSEVDVYKRQILTRQLSTLQIKIRATPRRRISSAAPDC